MRAIRPTCIPVVPVHYRSTRGREEAGILLEGIAAFPAREAQLITLMMPTMYLDGIGGSPCRILQAEAVEDRPYC